MSVNGIKFHTDASITKAATFKSFSHSDYAEVCERCGHTLKRKHKRPVALDGMKLCLDCRGGDPAYRKMRVNGSFIETTDEELEGLEEAS